ncbi:hypothetical protein [Nevskia sp.]|uniref:hypothetical protein n=1 Tax=Nevskia sp. TaxID=1929292 RepID=UPI0025E2D14E|nr:hypothetical protein [Nevskia sp.]
MIAPSARPDFHDVRLAEPIVLPRDATNSTGVAQEQPSSPAQGTVPGDGGGVLALALVLIVFVVSVIWEERR